jgi:acetyl esterase/lipase
MSGDKADWAREAARFADSGLAAASVTHRYCTEWPFPAPADDVQRALRWLRHRAGEYGLAASSFGATGASSGGHLASFLGLSDTRRHVDDELAAYSSRVSCVVDCFGPVDMLWMMQSASAPIVERFIGRPLSSESVADYLAASPMAMIAPPVCPFLIMHGTLDVGATRGEVPIGISERFAELLRAAGGEAEFMPIEGAGHGFSLDTPHGQRTMAASIAFFSRHLGAAAGSNA